jgi:hypothetical protein
MEEGKVPTHRGNVLGVEVITKGGGVKSKSHVAGRTLPPPRRRQAYLADKALARAEMAERQRPLSEEEDMKLFKSKPLHH